MPVLDAKALKRDPKGAAFLLRVLCRQPVSDDNPPKLVTRVVKKAYVVRRQSHLSDDHETTC